jgi:REP element-mobilizing transposase RayT
MELKVLSNYSLVYPCQYHLVRYPKYCREVLVDSVNVQLTEENGEKMTEGLLGEVSKLGIMSNYIHQAAHLDWGD